MQRFTSGIFHCLLVLCLAGCDNGKPRHFNQQTLIYSLQMQGCEERLNPNVWVKLTFVSEAEVVYSSLVLKSPKDAAPYHEKITVRGTYSIKNEVVKIKLGKAKAENSREGQVFETVNVVDFAIKKLDLKISQCSDGRLKLLSNVNGQNALGNNITDEDKSCWLVAKLSE